MEGTDVLEDKVFLLGVLNRVVRMMRVLERVTRELDLIRFLDCGKVMRGEREMGNGKGAKRGVNNPLFNFQIFERAGDYAGPKHSAEGFLLVNVRKLN